MNAFLLQDMFPITDKYIADEFRINGNHMLLTSDSDAEIVLNKAHRILNMIHRNIKFSPSQPDVLAIEEALVNEQE